MNFQQKNLWASSDNWGLGNAMVVSIKGHDLISGN